MLAKISDLFQIGSFKSSILKNLLSMPKLYSYISFMQKYQLNLPFKIPNFLSFENIYKNGTIFFIKVSRKV